MGLPEFLYRYAVCSCGVRSAAPMDPDVAEHWKCAACLNQSDLFMPRCGGRPGFPGKMVVRIMNTSGTFLCTGCPDCGPPQMRPAAGFGGKTFDPEKDDVRLGKQMRAVFDWLRKYPHKFWTLRELEIATGYPQPSISARIRDLRKPPFEYPVPRRRRSTGTWEYALIGEES